MAKQYRQTPDGVFNTVSKATIPEDPNNRDYRKYLDWVALGNTPDSEPVIVKSDLEKVIVGLTDEFSVGELLVAVLRSLSGDSTQLTAVQSKLTDIDNSLK